MFIGQSAAFGGEQNLFIDASVACGDERNLVIGASAACGDGRILLIDAAGVVGDGQNLLIRAVIDVRSPDLLRICSACCSPQLRLATRCTACSNCAVTSPVSS